MFKKKNTNNSDQQIWNDFIAGDDKAYAFIYKKHIVELYNYGLYFTPNRELVKDSIQDVFVKIYCNRATLTTTNNIKLYLFKALKNTLFNVFQKDKYHYHIDTIEPVFSVEFSVEDILIQQEMEQERQSEISHILDSLTPRQKEVIYYRYIEGMDIDAICELMSMNYQSVQNLIQRSFKKIRTLFPSKNVSILSIKRITGSL